MKKTKLAALKTREDAENAVARFVGQQLEQVRELQEMEAQIKDIRDRHRVRLGVLEVDMEMLFEQLEQWAVVNMAQFTPKKSLEFAHATIGFRTSPPRLKPIGKFTWDRVLDLITSDSKLSKKFIRIKNEIDREALIAERDELGPETLKTIALAVVRQVNAMRGAADLAAEASKLAKG